MANMAALEAKIDAMGIKKFRIAEALGVTGQTLRVKLAGDYEFKASEIKTLKDILHLTDEERDAIFFG